MNSIHQYKTEQFLFITITEAGHFALFTGVITQLLMVRIK